MAMENAKIPNNYDGDYWVSWRGTIIGTLKISQRRTTMGTKGIQEERP